MSILNLNWGDDENVWNGVIPQTINPKTNYKIDVSDYVDKYVDENIKLTDTYGELKLYHYTECNDQSNEMIKRNRGIIRNAEDKIVCSSFGYTQEVCSNNPELIKSIVSNFSQCHIYDAEEGATIRLFYHKDRWNISTHRKINAYFSKWGNPKCKSFGELFMEGLVWELKNGCLKDVLFTEENVFDEYCNLLDINKTYAFLVRNCRENRIVCVEPEHPQIFFIGSFDNKTNLLVEGNTSHISYPHLNNFSSIEDVITYVNNIDYTRKQGVIIYMPNQTQLKILNPIYCDYFKIRGNEPSIKFRYLQLRTDKNSVAMLYNLYPEFINEFEKYENILTDLGAKIHKSYIKRYINNEYISVPQPEYFIMQRCHEWHLEDRIHNKINYYKILDIIDNQTATSLNKLIKPYLKKNN